MVENKQITICRDPAFWAGSEPVSDLQMKKYFEVMEKHIQKEFGQVEITYVEHLENSTSGFNEINEWLEAHFAEFWNEVGQYCLNCETDMSENEERLRFQCLECGYINDLDFDEMDSVIEINLSRVESLQQDKDQACWDPNDLELKLAKYMHDQPTPIVIGEATLKVPQTDSNAPRIYIPAAYKNDPRLKEGKDFKYDMLLIDKSTHEELKMAQITVSFPKGSNVTPRIHIPIVHREKIKEKNDQKYTLILFP